MRFFPDAHTTGRSQILDAGASNPAFEQFYRDHLRKILLVRGGKRYLSKGNYNITRLGYLQKLFPDARFIVPVRDPAWHVASLMKQHKLFADAESRDPRILKHMQRVGHFEFGLDRRAVDLGDGVAASIEKLWRDGQEVRGWARLWASLYCFAMEQGRRSLALAEPTLIVRYEDLCEKPEPTLARIFNHVGLDLDPATRAAAASRLSPPAYYRPDFTPDETRALREETERVATALGYA